MTENKFKNYALILITTIIISLISMLFSGILGAIFSALLASIIGYTVTKHHYYFVATVCACVIAIYTIFAKNFVVALAASLPTILCGLSLGIAYNVKISQFFTIGILTVIQSLNSILNIKLLSTGKNAEDFLTLFSNIYKEAMTAAYGSQLPQADIDAVFTQLMSVVTRFLPSFLIISSILVSLLMLFIFKKVLTVTKNDVTLYEEFSQWRAQASFSIVYILLIVIRFSMPATGYMPAALENVIMVTTFVFYIFGLSYLDFLLIRRKTKNHSKRIILVLVTIFTIIAIGLPFLLVCALGIADGCFDFRKRLSKKQSS